MDGTRNDADQLTLGSAQPPTWSQVPAGEGAERTGEARPGTGGASSPARGGQAWRKARNGLIPAAVLVVLVAAWQLLVPVFGIGAYLLPTPVEVAQAAITNGRELAGAVVTTALTAAIAFVASAAVGVATAIAIAHGRVLERSVMPLLILLWTAPTVAIAPVVVVWLGVGIVPVVVIAMVICFFPIVANVVSGIRSVSESSRDLLKVYGSTRWQVLCWLELPSALPQLFSALKITAALAMVGTISGEYVAGVGGGSGGLGYIIIVTGSRLETAYLFAASIVSALLWIAVYWLVAALEKRLLGSWHESARTGPGVA